MIRNLNYNRTKAFRFTTSVLLIAGYILESIAKNLLPHVFLTSIIIIFLVLYIISLLFVIRATTSRTKVILDELVFENEAKANSFTVLILNMAVFVGIVFTKVISGDVVLSFNILFCVMLAISAVNDGYYLYLEKKGVRYANIEDED